MKSMEWSWRAFDALTPHEMYALLVERARVFVVEQTCFYQDPDGLDPSAWHLLGWRDGALVAYLRAFPPGVLGPEMVIGRVLTAPEVRGTGLGRPLMEEGMRRAFATWGEGPIRIGAQSRLRDFYASLGFVASGPEYDEDGIPHLPMRREAGVPVA